MSLAARRESFPAPNARADRPSPRIMQALGPGLLGAKDFILPELVGREDNGDLSVVGGCTDAVQLAEVFELVEVREERREFGALPAAEQQLERRRYKDWSKRNAKKGRYSDEFAIWLQGGAEAEENFHNWWERKEDRRRTGLLRKANRLANCKVTGRRLDCSQNPDHKFFGTFNCGNRYCRHCGPAIFSELFGKYMGLWSIVEKLVVQPGFRSANHCNFGFHGSEPRQNASSERDPRIQSGCAGLYQESDTNIEDLVAPVPISLVRRVWRLGRTGEKVQHESSCPWRLRWPLHSIPRASRCMDEYSKG
jgi:hypothetical protein